VQRGIARHQFFHALKIVAVNGLLELSDFFQRFDVSFQLGPAGKPVELCDLVLRVGERCGLAGFEKVFEQIFGLVFEMAEIRTIRQRAWSFWGIGRHGDLLSWLRPLSAPSG
jgi:hypothetical protein